MGAVISACGRYRYWLDRDIEPPQGQLDLEEKDTFALKGKVIGFFGVNPSWADATQNDATVKKLIGFCRLWGASRLLIGNVFAYRASDVRELKAIQDPCGPDWRRYTQLAIDQADVLLGGWGRLDKLPKNLRSDPDHLKDMLFASRKPVLHLGLTGCGQPRHPQMLGYATPPAVWNPATGAHRSTGPNLGG